MTCRPRMLVIGAGVAGSACAIQLGRQGFDVDIVEQKSFPRPKVCGCCLGGSGLACLEELSLRDAVCDGGTPTHRWIGSFGDSGSSSHVELDLPDGLAISRAVLDPLLASEAEKAGANLSLNCAATIRHADQAGVSVTLRRDSVKQDVTYDLVVIASGLASCGANEILPWTQPPHGPFGISFNAAIAEISPHTIYMACGDDGYVGLVKLADGSVDVAAALRSGSQWARELDPQQRVDSILASSAFAGMQMMDVSGLRTTPPLRRQRRFGKGRVIAIGDAAGYVEPFTGEGMTWALESAAASADMIAKSDDFASLGDQWQTRLKTLLGRKKQVCGLVTRALRHRALRQSAARIVSSFPGVASPLVSYLNSH